MKQRKAFHKLIRQSSRWLRIKYDRKLLSSTYQIMTSDGLVFAKYTDIMRWNFLPYRIPWGQPMPSNPTGDLKLTWDDSYIDRIKARRLCRFLPTQCDYTVYSYEIID